MAFCTFMLVAGSVVVPLAGLSFMATLPRLIHFPCQAAAVSPPRGRTGMHDRTLTFFLQELHDDRGDGFGPGDQEQMAVVDNV
ncbi:hypothetical protein D3C78_1756330 [compost metagenome]